MGFFDSLNRAIGHGARGGSAEPGRLAEAWGLRDTSRPEQPADASTVAAHADTLDYDRAQWRKKLKRILEKLPASQAEWEPMLTEARALAFDEEWMLRAQIEEFGLMLRRAVADCHVTPEEHRRIDLARSLIDIPEAEAEAMLQAVIAEAEAFFGHSVEGA